MYKYIIFLMVGKSSWCLQNKMKVSQRKTEEQRREKGRYWERCTNGNKSGENEKEQICCDLQKKKKPKQSETQRKKGWGWIDGARQEREREREGEREIFKPWTDGNKSGEK